MYDANTADLLLRLKLGVVQANMLSPSGDETANDLILFEVKDTEQSVGVGLEIFEVDFARLGLPSNCTI